ncbi:hypothetical protein [Limosilactobacillus mucosae]|uniref:hypothetical protein n=1 Tax=Limosilactobacillus mucosae TaxID=97478 RepID=UPI00233E58AF|nr:hypothetical protein [Limosilactobacillus mucosae]MDC2842990.1 hypothetical protein [Limosilactobacillus mucosae]
MMVELILLQPDDRERFIKDNQWAFKYGALEEFGKRNDQFEEGDEIIARQTIENLLIKARPIVSGKMVKKQAGPL